MTAPKKFFKDNVTRISQQQEPEAHNLNLGLYHLSVQIEDMQNTLRHLQNEIAQVHRDVRNLPH